MRYYHLLPNWSARWNGWRDGAKDYPNDNTPAIIIKNVTYGLGAEEKEEDVVECAAPFESRLCNHAHRVIDKIRQQWQARDGKLHARHHNALSKLEMAGRRRDEAKQKFDTAALCGRFLCAGGGGGGLLHVAPAQCVFHAYR